MICRRGLFVVPGDIEQRIEDHARYVREALNSKNPYPKRWIRHEAQIHESPLALVAPRALILGPNGKPIEDPR